MARSSSAPRVLVAPLATRDLPPDESQRRQVGALLALGVVRGRGDDRDREGPFGQRRQMPKQRPLAQVLAVCTAGMLGGEARLPGGA